MDMTTYAVDASTLINGIHEIKQWIYNGQLRILIPTCSVQEVEKRYKASLIPKEQPKEPSPKKVSGRPARREQPLFDINPRTAWEFVSRAKSWSEERGVEFQAEGEEFTQWKEEEEAQKATTPPAAPATFVEALWTKSPNQGASDFGAAKAPTKPKLVSRISETTSPWKSNRIPTIDSASVPGDYRTLFECILWRLYECEAKTANPAEYAMMADDASINSAAASLKLVARTRSDIRSSFATELHVVDHRELTGQLEKDFPETVKYRETHARSNGHNTADAPNRHAPVTEPVLGNGHAIKAPTVNGLKPALGITQSVKHGAMPMSDGTNPLDTLLESLTQTSFSPPRQERTRFEPFESLTASIQAQTMLSDRSSPSAPVDQNERTPEKAAAESDSESDEDVIVFNPRAKRLSGRPQTPARPSDQPKSRPGTADGNALARSEPQRAAKSPIISTLKPQSPVFTPGQIYAPAVEATSPSSRPNGILPHPTKSPSRSPRNTFSKPSPSKPPASPPQARAYANDQLQRQQSEMIIKKQREAIQRQAKAATKPPPRQVQLEPTDNPTVIDPDAFDRSYVVQPPTQTPERAGRRQGGGRRRNSPKEGSRQQVRSAGEPDDDFILKSGTPRGATRGRGKLWVP